MCRAYYATKYSSSPDMLIFSEGKKVYRFPCAQHEANTAPRANERGFSRLFLFCFPRTLFPFGALLFVVVAQRRSARHIPNLNSHKTCDPPPPIHTHSPHHSHLTFCFASNSYDNIFAGSTDLHFTSGTRVRIMGEAFFLVS